MVGRIIGLLISIGMIFAGLSGEFVLAGTESSAALVVFGLVFLVVDIIGMVKASKKQEELKDSVKPTPTPTTKSTTTATPKPASNLNTIEDEDEDEDEQVVRSFIETKYYFKGIFGVNFGDYEVRENIPVVDVAGYANEKFKLYETRPYQAYKAEWGNPYTFGLFQNDEAKALIMVGDGHEMCKKVKYLISKMYAKKCNIPYITFWVEAPNEKKYVIDRINKYLHNGIQ